MTLEKFIGELVTKYDVWSCRREGRAEWAQERFDAIYRWMNTRWVFP
jgi:hypothetical protein